MRRATLVLLCGLPGSGKTTLARRLEPLMPAVRLCPDEWLSRLGVDLYDAEFRDRVEAQHWLLAQDLLRRGCSAVLESGFWSRAERDEKRLAAGALGAGVELRYLEVPIDELSRRVTRREVGVEHATAPITRAQLVEWCGMFQPPDPAELALFDPPAIP